MALGLTRVIRNVCRKKRPWSMRSSRLPSKFPGDQPDLPVVNVTIADATAFAKWANKRLPTALEWEKAARGTEGKTWPWGQADDARLANVRVYKSFEELAEKSKPDVIFNFINGDSENNH